MSDNRISRYLPRFEIGASVTVEVPSATSGVTSVVLVPCAAGVVTWQAQVFQLAYQQAVARGEPYSFPGWETALGWFEGTGHRHPPIVIWRHGSDEWETPAALFDFLDGFFHFDIDVCASAPNAKMA